MQNIDVHFLPILTAAYFLAMIFRSLAKCCLILAVFSGSIYRCNLYPAESHVDTSFHQWWSSRLSRTWTCWSSTGKHPGLRIHGLRCWIIALEIWFFSDIFWLVGGLEHEWIMTFHIFGNFIIPTDELIFFRGVGIPPTSLCRVRFDKEPIGQNLVLLFVLGHIPPFWCAVGFWVIPHAHSAAILNNPQELTRHGWCCIMLILKC